MLQSLFIQNYALIDELNISFDAGFSIITGETGAGKSILLGALSLLVGQRADATVLLDKSKKCFVEGTFKIGEYKLQKFFSQNEIDYDESLIIRREILDNGRSRAFVNDTPVNLNILKDLGDRLIDIHSQHQNSYLTDNLFQLRVIDNLAKNLNTLENYKETYKKYIETNKQLIALQEKASKEQTDLDYYKFQFNELDAAKLKQDEQPNLEEELKLLSHAEEIKTAFTNISGLLHNETSGIVGQLKEAFVLAGKTKQFYSKASNLTERIESAYIDLKDVAQETETIAESIDLDPSRLELVKNRLDSLYSLCQKHRVSNSNELISIRESFLQKIIAIDNFDEQLKVLKIELETEKKQLSTFALALTKSRTSAAIPFEEKILVLLQQLGMPNASFSARFETNGEFLSNGCDKVTFLFSANKQIPMQDISKVASGGEISRVMLSIKSVIAQSLAMPAVIFDEIDTGVSGDIADKMGNIMKQMAVDMQVISITHLPQVASKGQKHYMVFKTDGSKATNTQIKQLNNEERILEIAKMLSGEQISEAAMNNAKVLLSN